ncbi:MAG: DUF3343 domain-containing protein [Ruminococcaceae bacterium]|nr:DUF3343 domain-containing protein [Oscillospiraceae bacterium]
MNTRNLIILRSVTYAAKARNILLKHGINSDVVKTPRINGKSLCGYSLYVPNRFDDAVSILLSHGVQIEGRTDSDDM